MTRGRTLSSLALVGAFALLCTAGLGFLAVSMGLHVPGLRQGWRLEAGFASADGLVAQSDVDVSGVQVGHVLSIGPDGHGGVLVTMVLDDSVRLRQDVVASVRPKSLIGETYVELVRQAGSTAPYARDGYRLPRSQTGQAVQIDDILNEMDPVTRAAFSSSLRELGVAVNDRQGDVNATIPALEQATANLRPLARIADARQQQIGQILSDLAIIMTALADEQDALGQVVDSGDVATGALARRDQQLAGTLQQGNKLLGSLDTALADTTPADRSALQEAPGTLSTGRQLLSTLNPAVDRLLPEVLLAQLNYPNNQLSVSSPQAVSLAEEWISAFSQTDQTGHSFRITPVVDPSTLLRQPALPSQVPVATTPVAGGQPAAGPAASGQAAPAAQGLVPSAIQMLLGLP